MLYKKEDYCNPDTCPSKTSRKGMGIKLKEWWNSRFGGCPGGCDRYEDEEKCLAAMSYTSKDTILESNGGKSVQQVFNIFIPFFFSFHLFSSFFFFFLLRFFLFFTYFSVIYVVLSYLNFNSWTFIGKDSITNRSRYRVQHHRANGAPFGQVIYYAFNSTIITSIFSIFIII